MRPRVARVRAVRPARGRWRTPFRRPAVHGGPRSTRFASGVLVIEVSWIPGGPVWKDAECALVAESSSAAPIVRDVFEGLLKSAAKGCWIGRPDIPVETRLQKRFAEMHARPKISMWAGATPEEWDLIAMNLALNAPSPSGKFLCVTPRVRLEACDGVKIVPTSKKGMPVPSLATRHYDVSGNLDAITGAIQAAVDEGLYRQYTKREIYRLSFAAIQAGLVDTSVLGPITLAKILRRGAR